MNGCILWYMRALDVITCKALNTIGRKQSKETEQTKRWTNWLLDYLATHPDGKTRFWQSDMRLLIYSDALFLVEWDGKINYGGLFTSAGIRATTRNKKSTESSK